MTAFASISELQGRVRGLGEWGVRILDMLTTSDSKGLYTDSGARDEFHAYLLA
jgi:hypothetical protein